ncbi:MAG: hypothetical protein NT136_02560 [Candidatus Moranbacteria bacterium]|nr:hypothetical protein [Candidatus Moranbacteria bacterium]
MKKTILISVATIVFFIASSGVSLALWPPDIWKKKIDPAVLENILQARCEKLKGKLDGRISKFEERKEKHWSAYNNLITRLEKFAERLDARGYDTTDLESDLKILKEKADKFLADYDALINKLKEDRNYVCDHTDAEVKTQIVETRNKLKAVRQDIISFKNYYKTVIRGDIREIRNQEPSSTNQ